MRQTTITFSWPDGQTATLTVATASPEAMATVTARGARNRLPAWPTPADHAWLKTWATNRSASLGATLSIAETGEFTEWAD